MALGMNSVSIPGAPDFQENLGFGVVSGDLGGKKAFAQIAICFTRFLVFDVSRAVPIARFASASVSQPQPGSMAESVCG